MTLTATAAAELRSPSSTWRPLETTPDVDLSWSRIVTLLAPAQLSA